MEQSFEEKLEEAAAAFRRSQVLFAASRLGIFDAIGAELLDAAALANKLDCSLRGTAILCDALAAIGLLRKEDARYANHPEALSLLCRTGTDARNAILAHNEQLYRRWAELSAVVQSGKASVPESIDKESKHAFAAAMAASGRRFAARTAETLDLSHVRLFLDIGGGPGLYSIACAKRYAQLTAEILDDEHTLEVAAKNAEAEGVAARVKTLPGDIFSTVLEQKYDFIFISNVIHIYSPERNQEMLRRCAQALLPGGKVCIKDFLLDESRTSPEWSALFAVNMLINTEGGNCYTAAEVGDWLLDCGFQSPEENQISPQSRIVTARRS